MEEACWSAWLMGRLPVRKGWVRDIFVEGLKLGGLLDERKGRIGKGDRLVIYHICKTSFFRYHDCNMY